MLMAYKEPCTTRKPEYLLLNSRKNGVTCLRALGSVCAMRGIYFR